MGCSSIPARYRRRLFLRSRRPAARSRSSTSRRFFSKSDSPSVGSTSLISSQRRLWSP